MFEIKDEFMAGAIGCTVEALENDLDSSLAHQSWKRLAPIIAQYIRAANAEIKRLQSQPATFDDIPWEPVSFQAVFNCSIGIYQFRSNKNGSVTVLKTYAYKPWSRPHGEDGFNSDMSDEFTEFRKLPIALYTPAPEPAKRYEVKPIESGMFRSYKITERDGDTFMANMSREKAQELCDKLNRLEELEAAQ